MVVSTLFHKRIFLDTAPLIYFIEGHSVYQEKLLGLFKANDDGNLDFLASSITLLEVLVKPLRDGKPKLVSRYKNILLNAPGINIIEISVGIAEKAAELRAKYGLKTPDSLQLACAITNGADYFLTNDFRLSIVTEIAVITLPDLIKGK